MGFTLFISSLFSCPESYLLWVIVVMFSICFHEYCHAFVALKQGDATAAEQGHLTMNPMIQMGMFSMIMLMVIGISWGAVPINTSRMRHRYSPSLVAFAGPLGNIFLFLIFCLLYVLISHIGGIEIYANMLLTGAILNIFLFLFNMIPIPMLDGWTVFQGIIPSFNKVSNEVKNGITFLLFMLFMMTPFIETLFQISEKITSFTLRNISSIM